MIYILAEVLSSEFEHRLSESREYLCNGAVHFSTDRSPVSPTRLSRSSVLCSLEQLCLSDILAAKDLCKSLGAFQSDLDIDHSRKLSLTEFKFRNACFSRWSRGGR